MSATPSFFRNPFLVALFAIFLCTLAKAQPKKGEFVDVSIGYGISAPYEELDITGTGFYAQGEYVFGFTKWFGLRSYAGLILTSPNKNITPQYLAEYRVTSKAFLLGGKIRICAPIPWVAPYFEIGLGISMGAFETYTPSIDRKDSGVLGHIPVTLGLALGRNHDFELAFVYYFHPSAEQFAGAMALGFSFPIN